MDKRAQQRAHLEAQLVRAQSERTFALAAKEAQESLGENADKYLAKLKLIDAEIGTLEAQLRELDR